MDAVYLKEPWNIDIKGIEKPTPKEGEALIKVRSAGICGSDIGAYRGVNPMVSYPRILGHEIAGEVLSIPQDNPKGLKIGDRVVVDPYLYCGHCYPCSIGRTNCCETLRTLGVHTDGGMMEYLAHPAYMLHKAPQDMPWELIPLAEPLTIALHGLHRGGLSAGERVVIFGAGAIGLLMAMSALHYKAVPIVLDIVEERLSLAKSFGVPHTVRTDRENAEERVREYTNGRMAEVVIEASGANAAIEDTLKLVSHAGRIVLTGWPKKNTELPTDVITKKEVDVRGGRNSAREFAEAVDLIYSKKVRADRILTKVISLEEVPALVREIEKNPGAYLKVNAVLPE
ncbi:alcohol dehydrogenase [Synergistales bacterium]|nr:alcohol dehydrogenase [Synergistales bacterium]